MIPMCECLFWFFNFGAADLQISWSSDGVDFFYSCSEENIVNALSVSVTTSCGNTRTLTELEHL